MKFLKPSGLSCLASVALVVLGTFTAPAYADSKAEAEIAAEVTQDGNLKGSATQMSCDQIASEVVELDRIIRSARQTQNSSSNAGTGVSVAKTVGSLLIGSLGGVVGIVAVGALASEAAENSGEKAAGIEENAEERQNRLAGVFEGRGCEGELALTEDNQEKVAEVEPAGGTPTYIPKKPRYNE